jgi:hypothetical protein
MKHPKLWVALLVRALCALALGWGLWEIFAMTAALVTH